VYARGAEGCRGAADQQHGKREREEETSAPQGRHRLGDAAAGGAKYARAMRRELFRIVRTALDIVIVARETASMSSPSLNGSRTSFPLNCAGNAGMSMEDVAYDTG